MKRPLSIARWWVQGALLTYLLGFSILGVLVYLTYADKPPIPERVVDEAEEVVFTREDVHRGMQVFQRYGVMEYGSIYGHGAYLGPDFTADYLRRAALALHARRVREGLDPLAARQAVAEELRQNRYDPERDRLPFSAARAAAHRDLVDHYRAVFAHPETVGGLQAEMIPDAEEVRRLTAFFAWTAWTATARRPDKDFSYTNDWPPEPLVGSTVTAQAITWSAVSIIGLLGGMGLILFLFGRYDWLGWGERRWPLRFRSVDEVALTPGQRAIAWFLFVGTLLFFLQTLLGGVLAHYRAEPTGFFGRELSTLLPYNVARTWHVQLSIFWVAVSFLATAIFLAPLVARREPRGQGALALGLLGVLAVVVFGSLLGQWASVSGRMGGESWYWFGHQGWEYLDLGRFWQILLVIGLFAWAAMVGRGLAPAMRREHPGNMPWLLFYAALAIPAFYAVGLLVQREQTFVVVDFWRFWVVHLWVEDFLELFTTVMVATIFVILGMVREKTATRVIYLDVILYSVGGVVGTMHHLYFSGAPAAHMALGAAFSALEVIPLLLLTLEAWAFMRSGDIALLDKGHPHKWAVWFLISVGFWNFLGAGVFGFLINLPMVSYYQIGTALTANHAHTSMMGVYGMLAVGLLLFCARYLTQDRHWSDRAARISFWSLNLGLAWMSFVNLFPIGMVQLYHSLSRGYWEARSADFFASRWVNRLEWLRLPGDYLFIVGGVLPLLWITFQALRRPSGRTIPAEQEIVGRLFTIESEEAPREPPRGF